MLALKTYSWGGNNCSEWFSVVLWIYSQGRPSGPKMPSPVWRYIADRSGMCVLKGARSTEDTLLHGTVEAEKCDLPVLQEIEQERHWL